MTPTSVDPTPLPPAQTCQVFAAEEIFVTQGVNAGDGLLPPDEVCPGDLYELDPGARPVRLALRLTGSGQCIAAGSEVGRPGDPVRLIGRYRLMDLEAATVELLLMEVAGGRCLALPMSPMGPGREYTLLSVEDAPEDVALADLVCVSLARGTRITLGDGRQKRIEALVPGDVILTRDHGRQPLRWLGRATLRAAGAFAPVVIGRDRLGNAGDLIVSQHHRIFLYQRERCAGLPTSEVLVQAKHLVDGETVFVREGGFVDYFSLVFDRHEIVYAEGIPCESLMVNEATVTRLPPELAEEVRARFPGLAQSQHFGTEAGRQLLDEIGRERLLPDPRARR